MDMSSTRMEGGSINWTDDIISIARYTVEADVTLEESVQKLNEIGQESKSKVTVVNSDEDVTIYNLRVRSVRIFRECG